MRFHMLAGLLVAGVSFGAPLARADVVTFAREGSWQAYGGTSTNGTQLCGMSSTGNGKYFGLKFFKGDNTLTLQLSAKEWRIKNGAKQNVTMQIDQNSNWTAVATGMHFDDGDAGLEFEISSTQLGQFVSEFRNGDQLALWFPESDVSDWRASLDGSDTITAAFAKCVKAMGS